MAITYNPESLFSDKISSKDLKKIIGPDLKINKAAVRIVSRNTFLSVATIEEIALKIIRGYKKQIKEQLAKGLKLSAIKKRVLSDKKGLLNRVENASIYEVSKEIEKKYKGEKYEWLPSYSDVPDPLHQLKYGKIYTIGKGEMPGERYGCKCGMRILTKDEVLEL